MTAVALTQIPPFCLTITKTKPISYSNSIPKLREIDKTTIYA